jgi:hypothetical protein
VARMGEGRGVYRVQVGKPEGKRPLGRPRLRCEDNIMMELQEVGVGCGDWRDILAILAPTCFGPCGPSSGSYVDPC